MNNNEKTLEIQVELWALLGPFIMMVLLTVLLINPLHQPAYIPLVALGGLVFCWKWKLRGLIAALMGLGCLLIYQVWFSSPERLFWDIMVATALALTFCITALCGNEIVELLEDVEQESAAHLNSFLSLNEKIQGIEEKSHQELINEVEKNTLLQFQVEEEKILSQKVKKDFQNLQEKMHIVSNQNESLLRELFQKRHECEKLILQVEKNTENYSLKDQKLETREKEIEALRTAEQQYELKISEQASIIADLQAQIKLNQEELLQAQNATKEFITASDYKEEVLSQQMEKKNNAFETLKLDFEALKREHKKEIASLQEKISKLSAQSKPSQPSKERIHNDSKKQIGKSKNGKPTKTNNWANAILSRWSESDDPSH